MIAMVVGSKHIDFTPRGESKPIAGDKLQIVREPFPNEEAEGQIVDHVWLKLGSPLRSKISVGQEYEFCYDSAGGGRATLVDIRPVVKK